MIKYRLYGIKLPSQFKTSFDHICALAYKKLDLCENIVFDVNIVNKAQIQEINNKYRKINKPTDVITFANRDNKELFVPLIGEIFICLDVAKDQAKEYGHSLERELKFLFAHGLLHLLGYDHLTPQEEKVMLALTKYIIK